MSLDKAIESGKEHRKPYYDFRRYDRTCRNHGTDTAWEKDRQIQKLREQEKTDTDLLFLKNSIIFSINEPYACPHCGRVYTDTDGELWGKCVDKPIKQTCECGERFLVTVEHEQLVTRPIKREGD